MTEFDEVADLPSCHRCGAEVSGAGSDAHTRTCARCCKFLTDLAWLMDHAEFRRFLLHVVDEPTWCGVGGASFDTDSERLTCRREGMRAIGIMLNRDAGAVAPQLYMRALNEERSNRARLAIPDVPPPEEKT